MNYPNIDTQTIDEASREQWRSDAKVRSDFLNDEAAYISYRRAEAAGLVKILAWPREQK